jgi:hypothetical protein
MPPHANFRVDPRLATLLGEGYRSSEAALKELVDNSWDADSRSVDIHLPDPMSSDSVVIRDDGSGMTTEETRSEYLLVASDRRTRKGDITSTLKRKVKGRKGIGKFAGLLAADVMMVETCARGRRTRLTISKADLIAAGRDLEQFELPLATESCHADQHGTVITLSHLNQKLNFPEPERLRQILMLEYGREHDFQIIVNGTSLALDDLPGVSSSSESNLTNAGRVKLHLKVLDGKQVVKRSGIAIRVGGKVVGRPVTFGLEEANDIPLKLLKRVYGEIDVDGLSDVVTADGSAIIENSKAYEEVAAYAAEKIRGELKRVYSAEMNLAKARLQRETDRRLAEMPEHRRVFAHRAVERVMQKFYGESEDRIGAITNVVLDALEKDEYWIVIQRIDEAKDDDVEAFATALAEYGLLEVTFMAEQAMRRLHLLDDLDRLCAAPETLESTMHKALELNLWVLGASYSVMSSNKTLGRVIEEYTGEKFKGARAKKRPDLFLARNIYGRHLLIEFKRPSHVITRDDESQAKKYRDDLSTQFSDIEIVVLGHSRDPQIATVYDGSNTKLLSYRDVISQARTELTLLVQQLQAAPEK